MEHHRRGARRRCWGLKERIGVLVGLEEGLQPATQLRIRGASPVEEGLARRAFGPLEGLSEKGFFPLLR